LIAFWVDALASMFEGVDPDLRLWSLGSYAAELATWNSQPEETVAEFCSNLPTLLNVAQKRKATVH
jgi:hypothetical protein